MTPSQKPDYDMINDRGFDSVQLQGECIEEPCNSGIPLYLQPVCGCNDVTYSNWEEAECYGIYEYREGACDE